MARPKDPSAKSLTVGKFFADHGPSLEMELMGDSAGMERPIAEPTINRPGLALAGFFRYFASKRVQVAGHAELSYLRSLSAEERATRIEALFEQQVGDPGFPNSPGDHEIHQLRDDCARG
jgi:HPr kinase/phosphorylase